MLERERASVRAVITSSRAHGVLRQHDGAPKLNQVGIPHTLSQFFWFRKVKSNVVSARTQICLSAMFSSCCFTSIRVPREPASLLQGKTTRRNQFCPKKRSHRVYGKKNVEIFSKILKWLSPDT